ncbi:MAG: hypothetical protein V3R68_05440, partial [Gammaproteobacteria bacterium]
IVHESETYLLENTGGPTITLIACYPFDAIQPGGPLRYVVVAKPEKVLNLPALTHRESSRLSRDTLRSANCRQSRKWPHTWPARYRAGIASTPLKHPQSIKGYRGTRAYARVFMYMDVLYAASAGCAEAAVPR